MTEGFQTVLAASDEERRDLFVGAADRLRTNEQNIERDFWVCWTLDALFNELEAGGPRLQPWFSSAIRRSSLKPALSSFANSMGYRRPSAVSPTCCTGAGKSATLPNG
jgi:hypothetical protein